MARSRRSEMTITAPQSLGAETTRPYDQHQMLRLFKSLVIFLTKIHVVPAESLDPRDMSVAQSKLSIVFYGPGMASSVPSCAQCAKTVLPSVLPVVEIDKAVGQKACLFCPAHGHKMHRESAEHKT